MHDPEDLPFTWYATRQSVCQRWSRPVTSSPPGPHGGGALCLHFRDFASRFNSTQLSQYSDHVSPQQEPIFTRPCWAGQMHSCSAPPSRKSDGHALRQLLPRGLGPPTYLRGMGLDSDGVVSNPVSPPRLSRTLIVHFWHSWSLFHVIDYIQGTGFDNPFA